MLTKTEIVIHPYGAADGKSILHRLVDEFRAGTWTRFRGAVHFAKQSGNYDELLAAIDTFLAASGQVDLTFGADVFGSATFATELTAIETLLDSFARYPSFRLHLYHETARTFHPKLYLFSREDEEALLIVGSSNWSEGGFFQNVEANVFVTLELHNSDHKACFDGVVSCFEDFWQGVE